MVGTGTALVNVIGFISGLLTTAGFVQTNLPKGHDDKGASVKVKVGSFDSSKEHTSLGGRIEGVYGWDVDMSYLGQSKEMDMSMGQDEEFTIQTDDEFKDVQAAYVGLSAGGDGVCVAWIAVTQRTGEAMQGVWTGDVGKACGQKWYFQNQAADKNGDFVPACVWLDSDGHTETQNNETREEELLNVGIGSLKFYVPAFATRDREDDDDDSTTEGKKKLDTEMVCWYTAFNKASHPIPEFPGGSMPKENLAKLWIEERHITPRSEHLAKKLVRSHVKSHTAAELCNSPTSHGPDFIGSDDLYCDMETRSLHHQCSKRNVQGCVNIDEKTKRVTKRSFIAKRQVDDTHRDYRDILTWGEPAK